MPALLVSALLQFVFAGLVWLALRPVALPMTPVTQAPDDVLQIRFLPATKPVPPPQQPAMPPPPPPRVVVPSAPPRHRAEPPPRHALSVALSTPAPAAPARLFDRNGQPILPAAASSAPEPSYVQRMPQGDTAIMRHDSPVKYQATRFANAWGNGTTNAIDNALQKAVDKTTVKHTFRLPGGIRVHCAVSLAMLAGGCGGSPPPPPSKKDGDERLNMAPTPLVPGTKMPAPPLSACIALYRAGKPLIDGCPVDTPARAVDEEMREARKRAAAGH